MIKHSMRILQLTVSGTLLLWTATAKADVLPFSAIDSVVFASGVPVNLSFVGQSITATEDDDWIALGTFSVSKPLKAANVYNSGHLTLLFSILGPAGAIQSPVSFNAALSGVVNTQLGHVDLDFGSAQIIWPGIELSIPDISLVVNHDGTNSASEILWGRLRHVSATEASDDSDSSIVLGGTAVPEPSSVLLMMTSLCFTIGAVRWNRRARSLSGCRI